MINMLERGKTRRKKVIAILGGGLKKNKDGRWATTNYGDAGDKFGVLGDRLRIEAGALLYKKKRIKPLIVVSGGRGKIKGMPVISAVMKNELIGLGIPKSEIILESRSKSTYSQILLLKEMATKRKWQKISILSNSWHLPRIKVMIKCLPELRALKKKSKTDFVGAEDLLLKYDKKSWQKVIQATIVSEDYKRRIALEKKGIKDLKSGNYRFK